MNDLNIKILDEHHSHFDIAFKIIIVGDSFVGKSCLALKGTKNQFIESYNSTIGFEFLTFNIKVRKNLLNSKFGILVDRKYTDL
jgi:GTPase SAR1 family protein